MSTQPSPFRTWNGIEPFEFAEGVNLHGIGGELVLLSRVTYTPGRRIPLHAHEETEQIIAVISGELEVTVAGDTRTLEPGDTVVINRKIEHAAYSSTGVEFFEAMAPVPLDHVENPERDLVLGEAGGRFHVAR